MIVLLTDFGQSEYVGVMKGVITGIDSQARILDLCHDVRPQSVIEATWILSTSFQYFRPGTIFCCVIDPGVGGARRAIAVRTVDYYFVAPDNGLLGETLAKQAAIEIRQVAVPAEASRTFHGRDVFARAAAEISLGRFRQLGRPLDDIRRLQLHQVGREGLVVRIDHFGNIVTNLPSLLKDTYEVQIGPDRMRLPFHETYEAASEGELFLIEGSCKTLEISAKNASANRKLQTDPGQVLTIL